MKVTINGKEYECQEIKIKTEAGEIVVNSDIDKKKTGYERVSIGVDYYLVANHNEVLVLPESNCDLDCDYYDNANYYSSKEIAKNNARADKLMRQLRRFSVENRKTDIEWIRGNNPKYSIYYDYDRKLLEVEKNYYLHPFGSICFDSIDSTEQAIKKFKDELIWYFTEYKDSL